MEYIAVYTTLPDRDLARKLAKALVTERFTACANFFPVESIYRWEGKIEEERELRPHPEDEEGTLSRGREKDKRTAPI